MTSQDQPPDTRVFYARKLYALLQDAVDQNSDQNIFSHLPEVIPELPELQDLEIWWSQHGQVIQDIGSASDRVNLHPKPELPLEIEVRHPISGQSQTLPTVNPTTLDKRIEDIRAARETFAVQGDAAETLKRLYWWCWRFYPELREDRETALLNPAHRILPDCPIPSYKSTVAALTGAMFPPDWQDGDQAQKPYLLLFTFSPVQEFIKASRKFTDFWSGSYMLHYLSARLCWRIAQDYGPDAVITPSLWGQEIIDALLVKDYPEFASSFGLRKDPVSQFKDFTSRSLSTAGFPNTITALVPGKVNAIALGQTLQKDLKEIWYDTAKKVREHIKGRIIEHLSGDGFDEAWKELSTLFANEDDQTLYKAELKKFKQPGCWEWNKLWKAQIENTWQPYFVAMPLGHPEDAFCSDVSNQDWIEQQNAIALPRVSLPTKAEQQAYKHLNVGTWWGSLQARLGQSMQAVKNTRRWQIPIAPGERSSLSGQFSALHPCLHYEGRFKYGRGMAAGSIRLFWKLMSLAYPGLFDGSERLNALELTKRMAWIYGEVAEDLGIEVSEIKTRITAKRRKYTKTQPQTSEVQEQTGKPQKQTSKFKIEQSIQLLYERFSRFPNVSSIAAGRFIHNHPDITERYWKTLEQSICESLPKQLRTYKLLTRVRPSNIPKTDQKINPGGRYPRRNLNGVMFSSKWLAPDLGLDKDATAMLRGLVSKAHQDTGFGDSSPSDWWVLVLADGDGMGQYVNGRKLHTYADYLIQDDNNDYWVDHNSINQQDWGEFLKTQKRMGPATHVGLNRALLDFSNRLVPHLTEHRYCGRVIYSGGDDVLVALPLADLPGFLRSLRAAWSGGEDPDHQFDHRGEEPENHSDDKEGCGYWHPPNPLPEDMKHLPNRPLFTMGQGATMSMGIIVAHKSVPLPTVLENLWEAESEQAKKLLGGGVDQAGKPVRAKDGLCFRVIYGSGNKLEALMKGHLLDLWWEMAQRCETPCVKDRIDISPVLNRLAEELPKHAAVTECDRLCRQAASAILLRREDQLPEEVQTAILTWLESWETWAWAARQTAAQRRESAKGTEIKDLANLLRFTAFWVSRRTQELAWVPPSGQANSTQSETQEVSHD